MAKPAESLEKTVGAHHSCIRAAFAAPLATKEPAAGNLVTEEPSIAESIPFVPPDGTLDFAGCAWWPAPPNVTRPCSSGWPRARPWPRSAVNCGSTLGIPTMRGDR
ncbi:hypothetical protein ACFWP7_40870 [Streptomyces sp. NPDC058470]|uniref:hypothetical protein n=1 Tax=Streptomyces sp. NPDC058470 TaxID=3346515 RepID=UPI00364CFDC5